MYVLLSHSLSLSLVRATDCSREQLHAAAANSGNSPHRGLLLTPRTDAGTAPTAVCSTPRETSSAPAPSTTLRADASHHSAPASPRISVSSPRVGRGSSPRSSRHSNKSSPRSPIANSSTGVTADELSFQLSASSPRGSPSPQASPSTHTTDRNSDSDEQADDDDDDDDDDEHSTLLLESGLLGIALAKWHANFSPSTKTRAKANPEPRRVEIDTDEVKFKSGGIPLEIMAALKQQEEARNTSQRKYITVGSGTLVRQSVSQPLGAPQTQLPGARCLTHPPGFAADKELSGFERLGVIQQR